jgi:hypothetical protein
MIKLAGIVAVGTFAVVAAVGTARADTLGGLTFPHSDVGGISLTYKGPGYSPGSPYSISGVEAGEVNLVDSTTGISYNAFCTDIFNEWTGGAGYSLQSITGVGNGTGLFDTGNSTLNTKFTSGQLGQLKALLNGVAATNYIVDANSSAAVQVALWAIENEPDSAPGSYGLSTADLTITGLSGAALSDTQTLLTDIDTGASGWTNTNGTLQEWVVAGGDQDFTLLAVSQHSLIPEPGSLALLATGLAGVAALRRRPTRG